MVTADATTKAVTARAVPGAFVGSIASVDCHVSRLGMNRRLWRRFMADQDFHRFMLRLLE